MPKPPTKKQNERTLRPYVIALGKVAYSWNRLHEELAHLFNTITRAKYGSAWAIWHSSKSDIAQREMLSAAARSWAGFHREHPGGQDIEWLMGRIAALADARNDALHAPLTVWTSTAGSFVAPDVFFGNRRAKKLEGKELLREFAWCAEMADALRNVASQMWRSMEWPETVPWPGTPSLPNRGHRQNSPQSPPPHLSGRARRTPP